MFSLILSDRDTSTGAFILSGFKVMSDDTLEQLRREIDGVDEAIHDLFMRRAALGEQVLVAKTEAGDEAPRLRPGREAAILARLKNRHSGPLPFAAVGHVFRELITANLLLQMPLEIAVWGGSARIAVWDIARAHFGTATPFTAMQEADAALNAVRENSGTIAVMALEDGAPWWRKLADKTSTGAGLHVFARLPFFMASPVTALAVGPTCEESGNDTTLVVTENMPPESLVLASDGNTHLVGLPGFIEGIDGGTIIGCYANPVTGSGS